MSLNMPNDDAQLDWELWKKHNIVSRNTLASVASHKQGQTNMTSDNSHKMALAESIVDASRSLDRSKRRVELLLSALESVQRTDNTSTALEDNIQRCKLAISQLVALNNDVRRMTT